LTDVGRLRRRHIYRAVRLAMAAVFARSDFRIVHLSIQHDHVHSIIEAEDARSLAAGMSTFESMAARLINEAITKRGCKRRGSVFADRYHAEIIRTPRQARYALRYVMNNWRKHGEDRDALSRTWLIDPFSSAIHFDGWAELADWQTHFKPPNTYEPLPTSRPQSWLLREGWRRGGGLISMRDVPSA